MDYYAADYARQSQARESGSEASTTTQHEQNRNALARFNPKRITEYEDIDKSAYKDDVIRPSFDRMIADCRAGRVNLICVAYMSRLTRRDPKESLPLLLELLRIGVVIVSAADGEFRDDDQNSVITLIGLIMKLEASYRESANKSKAVRGAKDLARSLGGHVGGRAPYGFDLVKENRMTTGDRPKPIQVEVPILNEAEAAVLREAWRRIKDNMSVEIKPGKSHPGSLNGIATAFNDAGIPTRGQTDGKRRADSRWLPSTLKLMLANPRIAGMDAEGIFSTREDGTQTTKVIGYRIKRDADGEPIPWCTPIIDVAEWWQLQAWLSGRGRGVGRARSITMLSGLRTEDGRSLLTCECGRPMVSLNNGSGTGERTAYGSYPSYRCTRPRGGEYPGEHASGNSIVQHVVDAHVAARIFDLISAGEEDEETAGVLSQAARRYYEAREAPEAIGERQTLLAERADAVAALRDIAESLGLVRSAIVRKSLIEQESTVTDRLAAAESRLAELDESTARPLPIHEWLSTDVSSDPMAPGTWWARLTIAERREWFRLFVDNVTITKGVGRGGVTWTPEKTAQRVCITWVHSAADEGAEIGA